MYVKKHIDFLICLLTLSLSYNDCMATIRRLPSVEHNFQLVITKVYEDGDQDLLQDEDESEYFSVNTIRDLTECLGFVSGRRESILDR